MSLYSELIKEHNKKPRNYAVLPDANRKAEGLNPLCGDHIWLYLQEKDGTIDAIGFQGASCAICQSSASIMTTLVKGKPLADAEARIGEFRAMIRGEGRSADPKAARYFEAFAGVARQPVRVKCAVLPWNTLLSALHGEHNTSTEGEHDPVPGSGVHQGS